MVGAIAIVVVLLVSYYIARRITSPIEALALGAREFGRGNYDHPIDLPASGEVGQLASTFEQMRLSVRQGQAILLRNERLATIGQMASGIIHDLRSPLAAISTAAEVFASSELPPAKRQALACNQLQASHRMQRMLRELLEFALGKYALKRESVELAPFIRSVTGEALSSMTAQGVTMDVAVPPGIVVYIDSDHAGRLLTNLLVNSLQAMPGGGVIRIRADRYDGRARINVADTGAGIPTELRERLFEPFASHGKEAGTGLGLAIASSIAEAHGGSLTLVSGFDQPAEFRVELPLAPQERRNV